MIIKAKDITSLSNGNGKDRKIQRYRVERIFNLLKILKKQKQKKTCCTFILYPRSRVIQDRLTLYEYAAKPSLK